MESHIVQVGSGAQKASSIRPEDAVVRPRLLALDTSTHRTDVALGLGAEVLQAQCGEGGAQASAQLLPTLQGMLTRQGWALADLDALVFGRGPGAFTGLRTATAVVQGLAYGTRSSRHPDGLPVLPVDTLLAVAEEARHLQPPGMHGPLWVLAVLDARMGEVYAAVYRFDDPDQPVAAEVAGPWLARPEQVPHLVADLPELQTGTRRLCAGNATGQVTALLSTLQAAHGPWQEQEAWPTAHALLRLAPGLLRQGQATAAAHAQPLYVRDKVAQTTEERSSGRNT